MKQAAQADAAFNNPKVNEDLLDKLLKTCADMDAGLLSAVESEKSRSLYLAALSKFLSFFFNKACRFREFAFKFDAAVKAELDLVQKRLARFKDLTTFQANFKKVSEKTEKIREEIK